MAVAVRDLEESIQVYEDILGVKLVGNINQSPLGYRTAVLRGGAFDFELTSPTPGERTLNRFLGTKGEGVYRLAYAVTNLDEVVAHFKARGISVVERGAATGNARIAFTHPKGLKGVMLELVERQP